ncbi:archaellum operon transcriptional activator EarA family protein [Methanocella conradii]|uniref:archaellum operon transcriptional activator EarA family protein n=1 Tax=Methanocella conradii TaxID=1175444 RepID=UPI0024B34E90|nr:archaellum operon transcriptional activator EarA family protein [Methanocella conradii]MDI6898018.1 archaellum operon transcriptional activator EarA family protein [Methanocella conradii]
MFSRLGALGGVSTGYREEESLEHFGLVMHEKQVVNGRPVTVYSLTRQGFEEKGLIENIMACQNNNEKYRRRKTIILAFFSK